MKKDLFDCLFESRRDDYAKEMSENMQQEMLDNEDKITKILDSLDEDIKDRILEYIEHREFFQYKETEFFYKVGIKDGVQLKELLK